ncbi:TPA: hypothetical protein IAC10_13955 [Candidatus Scatousia excrementigallinarum]|uniref:Pyruvate carboxyltransferase domain-containing protein n=1 Tax=Candidatus Scatousia excrementigallinarum TaxID=2840935 RepID=A0A9D1F182_9BACT|nr:hypothetical protein [Candidatus Scatousia excrementigallinarum]
MTKILDCTIRDGGHLTEWNFSEECVRATFKAAQLSGLDFFEIGYRNHGSGMFARCTDTDLRRVILSKFSLKLVVMVNAREFLPENFGSGDYADFVRVACHPHEISQGVEICKILIDKGYETMLHLMDASNITDEQFNALKNYDKNNLIYFADSYGTLLPDDICGCFELLHSKGFEKIGFHGHNNKQLAFINTLTAIECGAYSVDVTAYGMGRGAGNTPAELLLNHLGRDSGPYIQLIETYYLDLYKKTPWGYLLKNFANNV